MAVLAAERALAAGPRRPNRQSQVEGVARRRASSVDDHDRADDQAEHDRDERQAGQIAQMRTRDQAREALGAAGRGWRGRRARSPVVVRRRPSAGFAARLPPVAISRPTSFLSAVRPSTLGDDLAAIHDRDAVGHLEDLVELGRHEQHRRAGVALGDRPG